MKKIDPAKHELLTIIATRKLKDALLLALTNTGVYLTETMYGKGAFQASCFANALGLVPEDHKIVITCVIAHEKTDALLRLLNDHYHFNRPNTGIAFTIPIEQWSR